jgi:hypothetical protein
MIGTLRNANLVCLCARIVTHVALTAQSHEELPSAIAHSFLRGLAPPNPT